MSVHNNFGQNNQQTQGQGQGQGNVGQHIDQRPKQGLSQFTRRAGRVAPNVQSGHTLEAATTAIKDHLEKVGTSDYYTVIPVDKNDLKIKTSCVLVASVINNVAYYYTLVLAGSITSSINPREYANGNEKYQIPQTPGDLVNDPQMSQVMGEYLARRLKGDVKESVMIAGSVIPKKMSFEDDSVVNGQTFGMIIFRVTNAIEQYLVSIGLDEGVEELNLNEMDKSIRYNLKFDWVNTPVMDSAGDPIRRQVTVAMSATTQTDTASMLHEEHADISSVSGYFDFQYAGRPNPAQNTMYGQEPDLKSFYPVFHVTDALVQTGNLNHKQTVLALGTITRLYNNRTWWTAFGKHVNSSATQKDINNLAALGHEAWGISDKGQLTQGLAGVDSTDPKFDEKDFLYRYAMDQVVYVLDVPQAGDQSWLMQAFVDAADINSSAYKKLYDEADKLTGGHFSAKFPNGTPMVSVVDDLIVNGKYLDNEGNWQDVRNFGYMGAMNVIGRNDDVLALEYVDTFNPSTGSLEKRVSRRVEILRELLGSSDTFEITGYSVPVVLNAAFLTAINEAQEACGCIPRVHNFYENNQKVERGDTSLLAFAYSGHGQQGVNQQQVTHDSQFRPTMNNANRGFYQGY